VRVFASPRSLAKSRLHKLPKHPERSWAVCMYIRPCRVFACIPWEQSSLRSGPSIVVNPFVIIAIGHALKRNWPVFMNDQSAVSSSAKIITDLVHGQDV
jgi:hypothetical protein